jgi:hypothetical protein
MEVLIIIIVIVIVLIIILVVKNLNKTNMDNPVAEMYSDLTKEQKYSVLNLLYAFEGLSRGNIRNNIEAFKVVKFMSASLGVTIAQADKYYQAHGKHDDLMKQLCSISDTISLDTILYQCFGLVMLACNDEQKSIGSELLIKTFEKLGYTERDITNTIEKINAMNKMFNH